MRGQLAGLPAPRPNPRLLISRCGPIPIPPTMTDDLTTDRRRRATQPDRDRTQRQARGQTTEISSRSARLNLPGDRRRGVGRIPPHRTR